MNTRNSASCHIDIAKSKLQFYFFTCGDYPKRTFERARALLMPVRVMICKLLLRMTFFLALLAQFFFFSIETSINAEPAIRFLLTVLSGSFPKMIKIFQFARQKILKLVKFLIGTRRS